jgi:hypothetical protein
VNADVRRAEFELVRLRDGAPAVFSSTYGEIMHPGLGPAAEADLLYVQQLRLAARMHAGPGEFVVWDIGLGAAANAIAVLRATRAIARPLRLVSFDNTAAPLAFALANAEALGYLRGYEAHVAMLLKERHVQFTNGASALTWQFHLGDFPAWLERGTPVPLEPEAAPPPDAILFDAFSPAKNPAMWTLPLFTNLFHALDPGRPCNLTTYSRSTLLRVTLLLAGFFVGRGVATGLKEETTVAANDRSLIEQPLDARWLERARRSESAEPLHAPVYSQSRLSAESWERLRAHAQFSCGAHP